MLQGVMGALFEELDYQVTPIGALSLRRRHEARLGMDVVEVKLGDEHLMSDLFTASERALARLGLAAAAGTALDVAVGGLGLGYTAQAALQDDRVASLLVVEFLAPVIDWHEAGILPIGTELATDPRCRLVEGDFFAMAAGADGLDPDARDRRFDAILVDIDHSPDAWLDERSRDFYQPEGLRRVARHLKPGGIFGLWSDDPPDPRFVARLEAAFPDAWAETVRFANPYQDREVVQTVYLARAAKPG
jgi:spermidine synthase